MVLIGVLRYFVSNLMKSGMRRSSEKGKWARNLRAAANFITLKSFRALKVYYTNEENGLLHVPSGSDAI